MNAAQTKYAMGRVHQIEQHKIEALREKYTKPEQSVSDEERAELVRSGKVKLRKDVTRVCHYTDIVDAFDFSKYEWEKKLDQKTFNREADKVREAAEAVRDQIMLGDEEVALKLLEDFAA